MEKNVVDMSAEEKLAEIRSLLGLESEGGEDTKQNDEIENPIDDNLGASISMQTQQEEHGIQNTESDGEIPPPTNMPDGEELILSAFRQARDSGKSDWNQMTTATLKSRILSLTKRAFREEDYGVDTLTEFIQKHDKLVTLDTSVAHPIVKLLNPDQVSGSSISQPSASKPVRIRRDLWNAVLDRSSGETYFWDPDSAQVKTGQPLNRDLVLPTVDEDLDKAWRQDFIKAITSEVKLTHSDSYQLTSWSSDLLPAYRLPSPLISRWNRFLTTHVVARLLNWFEQSEMELPKDLYDPRVSRSHRADADTERLRQLVLAVVQEMTERELSNVILPPRAVLRATRLRRND